MSAKSLIAWSIAGSDSGGGAGIQADLHTFRIFGLHGCSILTAITAQNTKGVQSLDPVSEEFIEAQWNSLITDLPPNIIKSGMLANAAMSIAALLESNPMIPYICDPVIQSTSGYDLISKESLIILKEKLLPRATLITPNIPEAQRLTESKDTKPKNLAKALINEGAKAVLVKGGHSKKTFVRIYSWIKHRAFQCEVRELIQAQLMVQAVICLRQLQRITLKVYHCQIQLKKQKITLIEIYKSHPILDLEMVL